MNYHVLRGDRVVFSTDDPDTAYDVAAPLAARSAFQRVWVALSQGDAIDYEARLLTRQANRSVLPPQPAPELQELAQIVLSWTYPSEDAATADAQDAVAREDLDRLGVDLDDPAVAHAILACFVAMSEQVSHAVDGEAADLPERVVVAAQVVRAAAAFKASHAALCAMARRAATHHIVAS